MPTIVQDRGYLDSPYLSDEYMGGAQSEFYGMQATMLIVDRKASPGMQAKMLIVDRKVSPGMQATMTVNASAKCGMQASMFIVNRSTARGMQATMTIVDRSLSRGMQASMTAAGSKPVPMQAKMLIVDRSLARGMQASMTLAARYASPGMQAKMTAVNRYVSLGMQANEIRVTTLTRGMQALMQLVGRSNVTPMSAMRNTIKHHLTVDYLAYEGYLTEDYLVGEISAIAGMQANMALGHRFDIPMQAKMLIVNRLKTLPMQAAMFIANRTKAPGMQAAMFIVNRLKTLPMQAKMFLANRSTQDGMQAAMTAAGRKSPGMQVLMRLVDRLASRGMQAKMQLNRSTSRGFQARMVVTTRNAHGMQVQRLHRSTIPMSAKQVIYNNTQLRILMEFPSAGTAALGGNNWAATSVVSGATDWAPKNLNTDIVEQFYRSETGTTTVTLTCDTGISQGVPVDTISIWGHNLTTSASVQVQGSKDGTFSPPDITFDTTVDKTNMFWIAPTSPKLDGQNRYWRFVIQDTGNPDTFIKIGTLRFGVARIFSLAESFNNPIKRGYKHFKDEIETEGFTRVMNDRALKRLLALTFEKLNYKYSNFKILDDLMTIARTSLKCVIIPTPLFPSRYAVYAKLTSLPEDFGTESIDQDNEYIDIELSWDESL